MNKYLFLVIVVLLSSCSIGDNINVGNPNEITIDGVEGNNLKFTISIPITNTNTFKVKIKDINLDARVNGKYLGIVTGGTKIVIPPNTKAFYDVDLNLEIKNIVLGATTIYKMSKNDDYPDLDLEGEVKASALLMIKKIKVKEENIFNYVN